MVRTTLALILVALSAKAALAQTAAEICGREYRNGAVDICREAQEADPDNLTLMRYLAVAYQMTGAYEPSLRLYRTLAERQPDNADAQYEYGYTAAFMRRYPEAVEPLERALRLEPTVMKHYLLLQIVYATLEREDDRFRVTKAAADQGHVISMFEVAFLYHRGEGVEQDDEQAVSWMRRAAEGGHIQAMDRMAQMHLNGLWGIERNEAEAEAWATRAEQARNAD